MIAKKLLNNIQKRGVYTINQNEYVGQTPVSIVNNTISLETNFVNKVNSIDNLQQDITNNTNSINTINTTLNGIPEQLTTITNNVSTNTQQIEAVKTKAETNETNIATINTTLPNKLDTATFDSEKTNFAKTNEANTFIGKNTFKNTGDIVSIQRTDNQSFGIDFKKENGDRVAFVGTSSSEVDKATMWGVSGLKLQTTNSDIKMISGSGDLQWESNRTWNQNVDNSIVRSKDLTYYRKWEYTSSVSQPTNEWNKETWNWTMEGINTDGVHEFMVCIATGDGSLFNFNPKIVWKNGTPSSYSNKFILTKQDGTTGEYELIFVIKPNNKFHIYTKKTTTENVNLAWVRCWVVRNNNQPWKADTLW